MDFGPLQEGRLLQRYKRFLADVELPDGEVVTAHCPNTGAMTGCAEAGSRVWLSRSASKTRKLPWTWELVETRHGLACIHSALANRVVAEGLERGVLSGFEAFPQRRREVKIAEGSRADLLLEGGAGQVFVEVKCVTLCDERGQGRFPDAVTSRGRRHLEVLAERLDERTRCLVVFCVFHAGVTRVSAAGDIDVRYREGLAIAMEAGVEVQAWGCSVTTTGLLLAERLPFSLDPLP